MAGVYNVATVSSPLIKMHKFYTGQALEIMGPRQSKLGGLLEEVVLYTYSSCRSMHVNIYLCTYRAKNVVWASYYVAVSYVHAYTAVSAE